MSSGGAEQSSTVMWSCFNWNNHTNLALCVFTQLLVFQGLQLFKLRLLMVKMATREIKLFTMKTQQLLKFLLSWGFAQFFRKRNIESEESMEFAVVELQRPLSEHKHSHGLAAWLKHPASPDCSLHIRHIKNIKYQTIGGRRQRGIACLCAHWWVMSWGSAIAGFVRRAVCTSPGSRHRSSQCKCRGSRACSDRA